jgi:hypothetical protein
MMNALYRRHPILPPILECLFPFNVEFTPEKVGQEVKLRDGVASVQSCKAGMWWKDIALQHRDPGSSEGHLEETMKVEREMRGET